MLCKQCKKEFTETHHLQKYCSKKCSLISRKKYLKNYHNDYFKTEYGKIYKIKAINKYEKKDSTKKLKKKYRQTQNYKESKIKHKKTNKYFLTLKKYQATDLYKKYRRNYDKDRRVEDPLYRLKVIIRSRFINFLKTKNMRKTNKTFKIVGCTPEFLKKYLEEKFKLGMSWRNHSLRGWHIDHKIPLSSAKNLDDIERLMHYTNLQPMWGSENIRKSNKII